MLIFKQRKQKYSSSSVNIVCSGNSFTAGVGASGSAYYYPALLSSCFPLNGSGITTINLGHPGYTWAQLTAEDDVSSHWVTGKTNILIAWETTNSVFNDGSTGVQASADAQIYIAAQLSAHPWKIVLVNAIPRWQTSQAFVDARMAEIESANAIFRASYRAWGCAALVDPVLPGSPYALPNYQQSAFQAAQALGLYTASDLIHPGDYGYGWLAQMIGNTLARLAA